MTFHILGNFEETSSGWWFGSFFIFPYIGNVIIPTDEVMFVRGVGLNHQPDIDGYSFT
jgi:hypothetical protein